VPSTCGISGGAVFHGDAIAGAGNFFDYGVEMNLEAVFLEDGDDAFCNIFVFVAEKLRGTLKNGDLAPEAAEELRKFQADVAPRRGRGDAAEPWRVP